MFGSFFSKLFNWFTKLCMQNLHSRDGLELMGVDKFRLIVIGDPKFDILNPSFTINTEKSKILVTANKGNFLSDDLILLQKNVYFESSNFKIFSKEATFNKKKQIANSKSKSRFKV